MEDIHILSKTFEIAYKSIFNPILALNDEKRVVIHATDSLNNKWEINILNLDEKLLEKIFKVNLYLLRSKSSDDFTLNLININDKDGFLDLRECQLFYNIKKENEGYKLYNKNTSIKGDTLDNILEKLSEEIHCHKNLIYKIKDSIATNTNLDIFECDENNIVNYFIVF